MGQKKPREAKHIAHGHTALSIQAGLVLGVGRYQWTEWRYLTPMEQHRKGPLPLGERKLTITIHRKLCGPVWLSIRWSRWASLRRCEHGQGPVGVSHAEPAGRASSPKDGWERAWRQNPGWAVGSRWGGQRGRMDWERWWVRKTI